MRPQTGGTTRVVGQGGLPGGRRRPASRSSRASRVRVSGLAGRCSAARPASWAAICWSRRRLRPSMIVLSTTRPTAPTKIIVPMTWTCGGRLFLMLAHTQIGNVEAVPDVKFVMMKSSIESEKASRAPAMMPGRISGKVTFQNVAHGVAPRSMAASSRWCGKPCIRARTVTTTKLMLNMMWAIRMVWTPSGKSDPPVTRLPWFGGGPDEQGEQARAQHDLGCGHRDEDEQAGPRASA